MDLLAGLNRMQREAVKHVDGPLLILAGAGSGKTRVLTHRAAYLIENGVKPYNILAITFTNKAAGEMRARVDTLSRSAQDVWVSTFHSLCVRILRREIEKIGFNSRFNIYDADDTERVIRDCIAELNLNDKNYTPRSVAGVISGWKNRLITPDGAAAETAGDFFVSRCAGVYKLYQSKLFKSNALDFDDIISHTIQLFRERPDVLAKYQERFKYIMVDEYQDTNAAQYELIRLLAEGSGNLCVVGDDDQSIYGWRGADIGNILGFEKDFRGARVIKLEQNYRSTQTILDAANAVIARNGARKPKKLWTDKGAGEKVRVVSVEHDYEEADFIASTIRNAVLNGAKYNDNGVLYRTNAQSRLIEDKLISYGIPYRLFGGVRFYERREIRDILAYLKFINNPQDTVSLTRIINVPRRGIGETTISRVASYADENGVTFFAAMAEVDKIDGLGARGKKLRELHDALAGLIVFAGDAPVAEVVNKVLTETRYVEELMASKDVEEQARAENVRELLTAAREFEEKAEAPSLSAFLEEVALYTDIDKYDEDEDCAALMTLHSAKGLEFNTVFIPGFEDEIFPTARALSGADPDAIEEERRLCYVGITRARRRLYIIYSESRRRFNETVYNSKSRFLKEIPFALVENIAYKPEVHAKRNTQDNTIKPSQIRDDRGVSQFAEIAKHKNAIDISFGAKNYAKPQLEPPRNVSIDFAVGDNVRAPKYGAGVVADIRSAGADYEITVEFPNIGQKKFMAHLSKLEKI